MLSDKAKGKQRALDTLSSTSASTSTSIPPSRPAFSNPRCEARDLSIRFTDSLPDLTISICKQDAVRHIKQKICVARPDLKSHRLRLIHSGRLLTDGIYLYDWLISVEERHKHAAEGRDEMLPGTDGDTGAGNATWLHCSVGPKIEREPEENEEMPTQVQIRPERGFDRLVSLGFSEGDIINFRRQFHNQSSVDYLEQDFATDEEYDEHARALEEEWIDSMANVETATLSQSSSHSSLLRGVLLGFFFPFLPFFFMNTQRPPLFWSDGAEQETFENDIFPQRTQMGLVVGFLLNVLFGIWTSLLETP